MAPIGKALILAGIVLVVAGIILLWAGRIPWIGRLPGDITIRRENVTFYFPLATCLIVSLILSLVVWLLRK